NHNANVGRRAAERHVPKVTVQSLDPVLLDQPEEDVAVLHAELAPGAIADAAVLFEGGADLLLGPGPRRSGLLRLRTRWLDLGAGALRDGVPQEALELANVAAVRFAHDRIRESRGDARLAR